MLFGVLRPMECGAYSFGVSEKQNGKSFLCDLSVSAVREQFMLSTLLGLTNVHPVVSGVIFGR